MIAYEPRRKRRGFSNVTSSLNITLVGKAELNFCAQWGEGHLVVGWTHGGELQRWAFEL